MLLHRLSDYFRVFLIFLLLGGGIPQLAADEKKVAPVEPGVGTAPELVEVGVWPTVIYNLDVHSNTFYMLAYVWFTWRGPLDPSESFDFTNNVESWGLTKLKTYPQPITFPDGRRYQCLRIEGRFFQPFNLKRFPLEKHTVALCIEENTSPTDKMIYRFDQARSGLDSTLEIPGWTIKGWKGTAGAHHYKTNFGDETVGTKSSGYTKAEFEVEVVPHANFFIWKMLLPICIILVANWTALLLHPAQLSTRVAMTGTALLTTVLLQQGYSSSLPEVDYLVLMDRIYVVVFLLIIASLIQEVIQGAMEKRHLLDDYAKAQKIDKISVAIQAIVFLLSLAIITITTQ